MRQKTDESPEALCRRQLKSGKEYIPAIHRDAAPEKFKQKFWGVLVWKCDCIKKVQSGMLPSLMPVASQREYIVCIRKLG
jgi:hypothetical protein